MSSAQRGADHVEGPAAQHRRGDPVIPGAGARASSGAGRARASAVCVERPVAQRGDDKSDDLGAFLDQRRPDARPGSAGEGPALLVGLPRRDALLRPRSTSNTRMPETAGVAS